MRDNFIKVLTIAFQRGFMRKMVFNQWTVQRNLTVTFMSYEVFVRSFSEIIFDIEFLKAYFGTEAIDVKNGNMPGFIPANEDYLNHGVMEAWQYHIHQLAELPTINERAEYLIKLLPKK